MQDVYCTMMLILSRISNKGKGYNPVRTGSIEKAH